MHVATDLAQQFQRLFTERPILLSRLDGMGAPEAAEELARIGAENGIPTSAAEIRRYAAQAVRASSRNRALEDAELDGLTGGVTDAIAAADLLDALGIGRS